MSTARTSPAIGRDTNIIGDQAAGNVYALSKTDGSLVWRMALDKSKRAIITSSPVIVGNRVVVGVASMREDLAATTKGFVPDFRGSVAAFNLTTGTML